MKAIKVVLVVIVVVVIVVVVLAGAGLYFANRYVQSPPFKARALATAQQELGSDVRIDELQASLWSGVTLRGVTIGNPTNFPGNLLTANAFVLRYRLLPLLRRRVDIEQLSLDQPVILLARNNAGEWNYEKLGTKETGAKPPGAAARSAATSPATPAVPPFAIVLSRLAITHGAVSLISEQNQPLVKIDGVNFSSSVSFANGRLAGEGKTSLERVDVAQALFVHQLTAPVAISADRITLAPLSGKIADGAMTGEATVQLAPGFKYIVNLQLKGGDMARLLAEAGTKPVINGKLGVTAALEGSGGLPTIVGAGRAEITDGRLMEIPVLTLLGSLLQVDALRDLQFSTCVLEFSITNNVMQTPVIQVTSPQVELAGKGSVSLDDYSLNHEMTIAFAKGALERVPREIRNLFTPRQDGSLALEFRVWGPYSAPKSDLQDRLIKGTAQQLIQKGLQKFLK
jgi:uncharacterized protein involved in outer membrane biogenesis